MPPPAGDAALVEEYRSMSSKLDEICEGQSRIKRMLKAWMDTKDQQSKVKSEGESDPEEQVDKTASVLLAEENARDSLRYAHAVIPRMHTCYMQASGMEEHCNDGSLRSRFKYSRTLSKDSMDMECESTISWSFACIHPNSSTRVVIDFLGILFLACDMVMIPITLTWTWPVGSFRYVSMCFWALDICCSFLTGYTSGETVEMRFGYIVRRYLRSWFLMDAALMTLDVCDVALDNGTDGSLRLLRLVRLGRFMRLFSLLRSGRVARVVDELEFRLNCDLYRFGFQFTFFVLILLWITHLLSCMWFAVGAYMDSNTGDRWVKLPMKQRGSDLTYMETSFYYQYVTSVHWAAAQITLGSTDIACHNLAERLLSLAGIFFGLFFTSSLISSISASMVDIQMANKKNKETLRTLREYLRQNHIRNRLARHVQRQLSIQTSARRRLAEAEVAAFSTMSCFLRKSLSFEAFKPYLCLNPFLRTLICLDNACIRDMCTEGIETFQSYEKDTIFDGATKASRVCFVKEGALSYFETDSGFRTEVREGAWISEAALFVNWVHPGTLTSLTACNLLQIKVADFLAALNSHPFVFLFTQEYARLFHDRFGEVTLGMNDLQLKGASFQDIIVRVSKDTRVSISTSAIDALESSFTKWFAARPLQALRQEMLDDKCLITIGADGKLLRMIWIACLEIVDSFGHVLVKVGHRSNDMCIATACKRFGGKQQCGESASDAIKRLMSTTLRHVADVCQADLEYDRVEVTAEKSKSYDVSTQYVATIFQVSVRPGDDHFQQLLRVHEDILDESYDGDLCHREVMSLPRGDADDQIVMWVTRDEYRYLRTARGDAFLRQHLHNRIESECGVANTYSGSSQSLPISHSLHHLTEDETTLTV